MRWCSPRHAATSPGNAQARADGTTPEDRSVYGTVFTVTFLREHTLLPSSTLPPINLQPSHGPTSTAQPQ
jgi:hypothetical protein